MQPIEIFYLNLASQVTRRETLVRSYESCDFAPHWRLHRFDAIGVDHDLVRDIPGTMSATNKACYLSALICLRNSLENDDHLMIIDDDMEFGREAQRVVDSVVQILDESEWDVLLTDAIIPDVLDMPLVFWIWYKYKSRQDYAIVDLTTRPFTFCDGSMIINRRAKHRVYAMMATNDLSIPWDIATRHLIKKGDLRSRLVLPFLTAPSKCADVSLINPDLDRPDLLQNMLQNQLRRMFWIDGGKEPVDGDWLHQTTGEVFNRDAAAFSALMQPILSLQCRYLTC
jgi:GR25 family glycosyltransferase involved in LPS biosynthesis